MLSPELVTYLKEARAHGMTFDDIRGALVAKGWERITVDQALAEFVQAGHLRPPQPVPTATSPQPQQSEAQLPGQLPVQQHSSHIRAIVFTIVFVGIIGALAYAYFTGMLTPLVEQFF